MSGAEASLVVGLISGIISIIEGTKSVYDAVKDKSGLPKAFCEVADRLPIVYDTLEATKIYVKKHPTSASSDGLQSIIKTCETRANQLKEIFQKAAPPDHDSRGERYLKAVRVMGKGARVESLMKGILEDLQLLTGNQLAEMCSPEQSKALALAIEAVSEIEPSIPDEAFLSIGNRFSQYGSGQIFNATGGKNQYNLGDGNQFQGENQYFAAHYNSTNFHFESRYSSSKQDSLELLREECRHEVTLTNPRDDRAEIISQFGGHVQGTCCWITRHDVYRAWLKDINSSLMWICGEPATGKTFLSIFLTNELEKLISGKNQLLAFYFCNRQDQRRNTALTLIRGLMHFLLDAQPELIDVMLADFRRLKKHSSLFEISNREALWRNLKQMLRRTYLTRIYIVLDALDECEEHSLSWVLPKLTGLTKLASCFPTLKIIIASRQLPVIIHESLHPFPRILIGHDSNLETELRLFISTKTQELAEKKSNAEENADQQALVRRKWLTATKPLMSLPTKTFLWVSFAVRDLEKAYLSEVKQRLQSLPRDLDGYYAQMLHQISLSGENQASMAARMIRWVVMALRPLSLLELSIATETHSTEELNREEVMADQIRLCGYFLKVNQGIVSLIHNSARDYLIVTNQRCTSKRPSQLFRINEIEAHLEIAQVCFQYVQGDGRVEGPFDDNNMVRLTRNEKDTQPDKASRFPFLQYTALHWPEHARRSSRLEAIFDLSGPFFQPDSSKLQAWLHSYWHATMPSWTLPNSSFDLFHLASFFGWSTIIERLLTDKRSLRDRFRDRVNCKCDLDMKPLHWAVRNGHEDTAKVLLRYGADKSKGYGMPAMIWAVRNSHASIISLLLNHGNDIDTTGYGMTALHWAVWEEREEMVRLLIKYGASVTRRTTSVEFDGGASEIKESEFPWTTVEEANLIFRFTESEEKMLSEKQGIRAAFTESPVDSLNVVLLVTIWLIIPPSPARFNDFLFGCWFIAAARSFLRATRRPAEDTFTLSSACSPSRSLVGLIALRLVFRLLYESGPGTSNPAVILSPENTCGSLSHDIGKKVILAAAILCVDRTVSGLSSKIESRWFHAYTPIFLPHMMLLLTLNQLVCRSTGHYVLTLDRCIFLAFYIGSGAWWSMWVIMRDRRDPPLGKTAAELAMSKGSTRMTKLLKECCLQD